MSVDPARGEEAWTEASLSTSPTSSYEDVGGNNGAAFDTPELSSFIVVSEGNSLEAPSAFYPVVNPLPGSGREPKGSSVKDEGEENVAPLNSERCTTNEEVEFSLINIPPPTLSQKEEYCRSNGDGVKSLEASGASSAFLNTEERPAPVLLSESSYVKVEISQKEALLARNANRELKLKVAKLSEILDRKVAEMETLRHSVTDFKAEVADLREERKTLELAVGSKDATIADLKLKLAKHTNNTRREASQDKRDLLKSLEKANLELSTENKELKEKLQQLTLDNKTLFERSTVLLSQIQDCETKRQVEACEKQVLEGKVDRLIEEMSLMRSQNRKGPVHLASCAQPCVHKELSGGSSKVDKVNTGSAVGKEWSQERHAPTKPEDHGRKEVRSKAALANQSKPVQETKAASSRLDRNVTNHKGNLKNGSGKGIDPPGRQPAVTSSEAFSPSVDIECPMCGKLLTGKHSLVALHVERCIQLSEQNKSPPPPPPTAAAGNKS